MRATAKASQVPSKLRLIDTLAATGDIGQALDAMDAAAPNLSHEQMTGLAPINFGGGFGGGFGGFGTGLFSQINLDAITAYVNAKNGGASEEEAMAAMNAVAAPAPAPTATATAPAPVTVEEEEEDREQEARDLAAEQARLDEIAYQEQVAQDLADAQAAEELAAPVAGDPTRAALYGDAGYGEGLTGAQTQAFDDTLAATGDVGQALVAMETVAAPAPAPAPAPSWGFTSFGGFGRRGGFSGLGRGRSAAPPPAHQLRHPRLLRHPRPLRPLKKRVLLERRVWRKKRRRCRKMWRQRLEETPLSQQGQAYAQAYLDAIQRGGTEEEAQRAGDRAFDETVAPAEDQTQEISPPDLSGRLADEVLGDVSGLGVDRPAYETGRGTVFEDVTRPSGEGVASVDLLQEEPLGPPPAGFTGPQPAGPRTPGDVDLTDRADQMFEWARRQRAGPSGWRWQVDEQASGLLGTIDERGVRSCCARLA
jgi:hypothetical protein